MKLTPHKLRLLAVAMVVAVLAFFASMAVGAVIYRWVDEQGRTHVSDSVPEKYRKSAVRIDTESTEVSPERQREAAARAAREKAQAAAMASAPGAAHAPSAAGTAPGAASGPRARRPAQRVTESTDCDTWRRLYYESQECFAPYRTALGGIKAEAYEHCNEVASPDLQCGPERR